MTKGFSPRTTSTGALVPLLLTVAAAWPATAGAADAGTWPTRPVRIVLGFPAATTVDVLVRPLAQKMSAEYGQQVLVDNRPGATGLIAGDLVAKAAPDGYTLLGTPGSAITSTPHINPKLPFDPLRDFACITTMNAFSYVLISHPSVPAKSLKDLIALAKARPGYLTFGSSGIGSGFHLAGELLKSMAKVDMLHVPYKGGTAAMTDMLAGRIDVMFYSLAVASGPISAGRLRPIAVTGPRRDRLLPDVPTIAEAGLPGYAMSGWHAIVAPTGTPRPVLEKLNATIRGILRQPEMEALWARQGMEVATTSLDECTAKVRADYDRYRDLIRAAGVKVQ